MTNKEHYSFASILELVEYCADEYGMREVVDYVKSNNEACGEYHNTTHLLGVTGIMLYVLGYRLNSANKYRSVELRRCMLAGLFHDMNHLCMGTDAPDSENIIASTHALRMYQGQSTLGIKDRIYDEAEKMIRDSHWPYVRYDVDIYSKLLRDADMLYTMFNNEALVGLFNEMRYAKCEFYTNQVKFNDNLSLNWNEARRICRSLKDQQLQYLNSVWGEI